MTWHRIRHKTSGEVQIVASLDGVDAALFDAVPIIANRSPDEFQDVDDSGALVTNTERRTATEEDAALLELRPRLFARRIIRIAQRELIAAMRADGVITLAQADAMRTRLNLGAPD